MAEDQTTDALADELRTPDEIFAAALDEYVGCKRPYSLIHRGGKELHSPRSFDLQYNRVVNAMIAHDPSKQHERYYDHAARLAIASEMPVVRTICYRPGSAEFVDDMYNMWDDPQIEPLVGIPQIFFDHLNYLIPNKRERALLVLWLAWIVQHPEQKVMWAILLVGRGGTGKSWIGKLMERILGAMNVVLVSQEDAILSTFNGFSENKRLIFLHETPPDEMAKLLDKVKGLITESHISINRKGIERYEAENFANLFAVSNEMVKVNRTNRRWGALQAADDPVGVDDRGRPTEATKEYYARLWDVVPPDGSVTDEARRVLNYLLSVDLTKFDHAIAPETGTKDEAAEASDGDGGLQARINEAYRDRTGPFRFDLLSVEEVRQHCGGAPDKAMAAALEEVGCRKLKRSDGRAVQITLGRERPRLWAISKSVAAQHTATETGALAELYRAMRSGAAKVEAMAGADADNDFGI